MVQTLRTSSPNFGAPELLASGARAFQRQRPKVSLIGKLHVFSDSIPCCFSEATLGEFSASSGSSMTLLHATHPILVAVAASGTERCR